MGILKSFLNANFKASMAFDRLMGLDESWTTYGTADFHKRLIPAHLTNSLHVYDIGGGKSPHIFADVKAAYNLTVTGVDIEGSLLARAPAGIYDHTLVADITRQGGAGDADLVISRAVLEHVTDTESAIRNISSFLKPGGKAILFAPCRNALFARLNLLLPEGLKVRLINYLYSDMGLADVMGFKAYYDRCTPDIFDRYMRENNLTIIERRTYWMSNYLAFCLPLHVLWRGYQGILRAFYCENACEGFSYVVVKKQ
jgi:SAM-dependent methyltransferase